MLNIGLLDFAEDLAKLVRFRIQLDSRDTVTCIQRWQTAQQNHALTFLADLGLRRCYANHQQASANKCALRKHFEFHNSSLAMKLLKMCLKGTLCSATSHSGTRIKRSATGHEKRRPEGTA
ncbi:hypothetical protein [Ruegeria atlantica]|uniref:hypothetical protein n=1 Tax=Ruegeria atlantica TaxID=81569 RepID=UPI00147C3B7A|nr:hypothetical protein [Ruegeria atlantica]